MRVSGLVWRSRRDCCVVIGCRVASTYIIVRIVTHANAGRLVVITTGGLSAADPTDGLVPSWNKDVRLICPVVRGRQLELPTASTASPVALPPPAPLLRRERRTQSSTASRLRSLHHRPMWTMHDERLSPPSPWRMSSRRLRMPQLLETTRDY